MKVLVSIISFGVLVEGFVNGCYYATQATLNIAAATWAFIAALMAGFLFAKLLEDYIKD